MRHGIMSSSEQRNPLVFQPTAAVWTSKPRIKLFWPVPVFEPVSPFTGYLRFMSLTAGGRGSLLECHPSPYITANSHQSPETGKS